MSNDTDRDHTRLRQLNEQYIDAVMQANVSWYQQHLAEDFICIDSEGTVFDKQAFLQHTSRGPYVGNYKLEDVTVRIYGETALVQATGLFTRRDGVPGMCRYTDVYAREHGHWLLIARQATIVP